MFRAVFTRGVHFGGPWVNAPKGPTVDELREVLMSAITEKRPDLLRTML